MSRRGAAGRRRRSRDELRSRLVTRWEEPCANPSSPHYSSSSCCWPSSAAAAGLGGVATPPQAQAGPAATTHWCNFVLAGKNATADGSVLMGYNNDWSANNYVYLQAVPGDATHIQVRQAVHVGRRARGRHQRAPARRPLRHRDRPGQGGARRRPVREEGLRRRDLGPHPAAVHDGAAGHHPARPDGADRVHLRRGRQLRRRRSRRGLGLRAARRSPLGGAARARQRRSSRTRTW